MRRIVQCRVWIALGCVGVAALGASLAGCSSPVQPPERASDAFAGPGVSVDSSADEHLIIVAAPTAGWDVRLDRLLDGPGYTEAFITLREPNPLFVNAQVIAEHRIVSGVPSTTNCRVLARIKAHDDATPEGAYRLAATAAAKPGPPPKPAPKPTISRDSRSGN